MSGILPYGTAIRKAIASRNVDQMKATLDQTKQFVKEQGDLAVALVELQEAIEKLEK